MDALETMKPLTLYRDNELAVFYANNKSSAAAKHIDLKYRIVRHRMHDQIINVKYISMTSMFADPLTKGLPPNIFHEYIANMGLTEAF
jgi:hypothetical protein